MRKLGSINVTFNNLVAVPQQKKTWCVYEKHNALDENTFNCYRLKFINEYSVKTLDLIRESLENNNYNKMTESIAFYSDVWGYSDEIALIEAESNLRAGKYGEALNCIYRGFAYNSSDFELYFMLGEIYEAQNKTLQAELCYRYSVFLCNQKDDQLYIENHLNDFKLTHKNTIPKIAFLLEASDDLNWLQNCLALIQSSYPSDRREIIIMENNMNSQVQIWIHSLDNIKTVSRPKGGETGLYNLGIEAAESLSDILIMQKGAYPLEHSLFLLQLSLYEDPSVGATAGIAYRREPSSELHGPVTLEEAATQAHIHNIAGEGTYKRGVNLDSPMVLLRRTAIKKYGWFDEQFLTPAYQLKDIGFRFISNSLSIQVCSNCITLFSTAQTTSRNNTNDFNSFKRKWNVNLSYSIFARDDLLGLMEADKNATFNVLEVGCACGATLLSIKSSYPNAVLYGIELDEGPARIAQGFASITNDDIEHGPLNYPDDFFDFMIFGDVLEHLNYPAEVLKNMKRYLKSDGTILASIPNVMHISVVKSLLQGNWTYENAGILDNTHKRFFTYKEVLALFSRTGYKVLQIGCSTIPISSEDNKLIDTLSLLGNSSKPEFQAYQYLVEVKKV